MDRVSVERKIRKAESFWLGTSERRFEVTVDLLLEVLGRLDAVEGRLAILAGKE